MKKRRTIIIFSLLILLTISIASFGFRITEELKQEVKQKQEAVAKNPNDPNAHFDLAITYAYSNYIQEGWNELRKVHEIDPTFRERALILYIKKVTESPSDWKLRFRLAFAYFANGEKELAIKELNNVLIIDPYNVFAYGYISLIYGEMGDIDKAIEVCKKGLEIDSQVAALHLLLSQGYYRKGMKWEGFVEGVEALRLKALGF
jgi:tetratricopeptide (TPR) repeat protein